jgi:hypothetical protein
MNGGGGISRNSYWRNTSTEECKDVKTGVGGLCSVSCVDRNGHPIMSSTPNEHDNTVTNIYYLKGCIFSICLPSDLTVENKAQILETLKCVWENDYG